MDSKYIIKKKAIQNLRHLTKIKPVEVPWYCDSTFSISTGSRTAQDNRSPSKAAGQTVFSFLKTEKDKNSANNSFQTGGCWSIVSCFCVRSSLGAKHPFTRFCHARSPTFANSASHSPASYPPAHILEFLYEIRDPQSTLWLPETNRHCTPHSANTTITLISSTPVLRYDCSHAKKSLQ